jgi:hypothetical protein
MGSECLTPLPFAAEGLPDSGLITPLPQFPRPFDSWFTRPIRKSRISPDCQDAKIDVGRHRILGGATMTKIVPEVQPPDQKTATIGECPHCSKPVAGFQIDATSRDDVVITLRPCECASHSSDGFYLPFVDLVKESGSLS